jgi:hypothetical protein
MEMVDLIKTVLFPALKWVITTLRCTVLVL